MTHVAASGLVGPPRPLLPLSLLLPASQARGTGLAASAGGEADGVLPEGGQLALALGPMRG